MQDAKSTANYDGKIILGVLMTTKTRTTANWIRLPAGKWRLGGTMPSWAGHELSPCRRETQQPNQLLSSNVMYGSATILPPTWSGQWNARGMYYACMIIKLLMDTWGLEGTAGVSCTHLQLTCSGYRPGSYALY